MARTRKRITVQQKEKRDGRTEKELARFLFSSIEICKRLLCPFAAIQSRNRVEGVAEDVTS